MIFCSQQFLFHNLRQEYLWFSLFIYTLEQVKTLVSVELLTMFLHASRTYLLSVRYPKFWTPSERYPLSYFGQIRCWDAVHCYVNMDYFCWNSVGRRRWSPWFSGGGVVQPLWQLIYGSTRFHPPASSSTNQLAEGKKGSAQTKHTYSYWATLV